MSKAMKCKEKSQRRAAELSGNELEEALSILSKRVHCCNGMKL